MAKRKRRTPRQPSQGQPAFGRHLKRLRTALNLAQGELAARLGKPPATVSAWETGKAMPGAGNLVQLARTFGIEVSDLLAGAGLMAPIAKPTPNRQVITPPVMAHTGTTSCPIYDFEQFGVDSDGIPHGTPVGSVEVPARAGDPGVYGLLVNEPIFYPRVWPGDVLLLAPNEMPRDGKMGFVIRRDGARYLGAVVISHRRQVVQVQPTAPYESAFELPLDGAWIHRVLSILPKGSLKPDKTWPAPALW